MRFAKCPEFWPLLSTFLQNLQLSNQPHADRSPSWGWVPMSKVFAGPRSLLPHLREPIPLQFYKARSIETCIKNVVFHIFQGSMKDHLKRLRQ
jgi:hypothetical protein